MLHLPHRNVINITVSSEQIGNQLRTWCQQNFWVTCPSCTAMVANPLHPQMNGPTQQVADMSLQGVQLFKLTITFYFPCNVAATLLGQSRALRNNVKYLGVTIDSSLKFDIHISTITDKTSTAVGIISKLRHYMPTNASLKIYYSLIHSQLLYGLPVWGSTYTSYLNKLITTQNKALKLISRLLDSPYPFYSKFEILKLPDLYNLEIDKLVHAHFKNKLPSSLSNYFTLTSQVSLRSIRSTQTPKKLLYIPRYSTNWLQRCIKYQGVKIWNDIPLDQGFLTGGKFSEV